MNAVGRGYTKQVGTCNGIFDRFDRRARDLLDPKAKHNVSIDVVLFSTWNSRYSSGSEFGTNIRMR